MNVYFISGLAADSRVFQFIEMPEGFTKICIDWIEPQKQETLPDYALRLAEIIDTRKPFVLVGVSMGGMIATEIAKRYSPQAVLLISSVADSRQLPGWYSLAYKLGIYKLVPPGWLKSISLAKRIFTTESSEAKRILVEVIRDSDPKFIRWAVEAILKWKNETVPKPIWHIHGDRDGLIPVKNLNPTHIIRRGTHLAVINRTAELNAFIKEALEAVRLSNPHAYPKY